MATSSSGKPLDQGSQSAIFKSGAPTARTEKRQLAVSVRGPAAAFDALWGSYSEKVLRTTWRITKNREDAEDALQDAFLKAYVHLQDFDGRSTFLTWLTRIAINSALMILRKRRSAAEVSLDDVGGHQATLTDVADRTPDPEAQYALHEQAGMLRQSISALPPAMRKAVQLRKLEERSLPETATMMGLSLNAAKTRIYRAKASLRASLKPRLTRPTRSVRKLSFGS
jgi:RNA polymerase sigma factor (sigma-70 family)